MAYGSIVAMYKKTATEGNMYYVHTDHLGSVNCVTDYMKYGVCEARTKPDSDVYFLITGESWLLSGVAALNAPHFQVDAASMAAGRLIGKMAYFLSPLFIIAIN